MLIQALLVIALWSLYNIKRTYQKYYSVTHIIYYILLHFQIIKKDLNLEIIHQHFCILNLHYTAYNKCWWCCSSPVPQVALCLTGSLTKSRGRNLYTEIIQDLTYICHSFHPVAYLCAIYYFLESIVNSLSVMRQSVIKLDKIRQWAISSGRTADKQRGSMDARTWSAAVVTAGLSLRYLVCVFDRGELLRADETRGSSPKEGAYSTERLVSALVKLLLKRRWSQRRR